MISYNHTPEETKKCGIYALVCIPTGKMYIGQTRRGFIVRWKEHYGELLKHEHNGYLQHAFDKYGEHNFEFKILAYLPEQLQHWCNNRKHEIEEHIAAFSTWLNEKESEIIKSYRAIYGNKILFNLNDGGDGNTHPVQELHERISKERRKRWQDPEYKARVSNSLKGKRRMSDEERKEISKRSKELWSSEEFRIKHKSRKGYKTPEETKKKCSASQKKYFDNNINARKKVSDGVKRYYENPYTHIARSEQARKVYMDKPELKQEISKKSKELWSDPDYRMRICKARGNDERKLIVEFILEYAYRHKPECKNWSLYDKLELIQYIASRYDKQSLM